MKSHKLPIDILLSRTSSVTGISIPEIAGNSRKVDIVDARQIFCCASYYSGYTYEYIAERIGRDHSSVIHLCNKRPLPVGSDQKLRSVLEGHDSVNQISSLAFTVYNNPNDEDAKEKLKDLL